MFTQRSEGCEFEYHPGPNSVSGVSDLERKNHQPQTQCISLVRADVLRIVLRTDAVILVNDVNPIRKSYVTLLLCDTI